MTPDEVRAVARELGFYANHFTPRDWDWTRDLGDLADMPWPDKNSPDGVLDGGSVIAYWEETGEYIQYVQPKVGALIAAWLTAEPDNPHAVFVATEMARIQARYAERVKGGEVTT